MSTQTLAEAAKLIQNELVSGIAEEIVTTNPFWQFVPWLSIVGQNVTVNAESTLGDVQYLAVGDTITAKAASTNSQKTFSLTTCLGDAEVNGLVQATSLSAGVDLMALEIASKAKNIGREMQEGLAVGTGTGNQPNSLHTLCDASQYTPASAGQAISFDLLDVLIQKIKAKGGRPDAIIMPGRTFLSLKKLIRGLSSVSPMDVMTLADGTTLSMLMYEGIPVFQNDYLPVTETANGAALTGGNLASVYAVAFDDGTKKTGLAMIYPAGENMGISTQDLGASETKDQMVTRIKSYHNAALFNKLALARLTSINN